MGQRELRIEAVWDPEASVWVATSDDVPGLVTEAESLDALVPKLKVMIPELLEENEHFTEQRTVPFVLQSTLRSETYVYLA